ncbi:deoxyribonuclease-1 [Malonomonas rubra DSM 5091]|uniref:Deoxyribonuclease-1 n=1 Tax=Malonomonas rubra DSM 5091 TaxID=1122189 RepID=A0A1M6ILS8_MALRU|nr:endonuclease [Malonomonas rubra]SHJ35400.1 deoxyribonuclease-1 [Malonomonas rubra DSM 5091]
MRRFLVFVVVALLGPSIALSGGNESIQSFSKAENILLKQIYADRDQTFYCGSTFNSGKQVFHAAGYVPVKDNKRANLLVWEHVVPAHVFGQSFKEWREGDPTCVDSKGNVFKGRKCAEKLNKQFRYMQADMHNLVPAIGELSDQRSSSSFAMIPGEERRFGLCDMEIANQKIEPPEDVRGDIARIYFYMSDAYPERGIVSVKNRKLFDAWDKQDPVDEWECEKERRVRAIQGNENFFVNRRCLGGYGGVFWFPL